MKSLVAAITILALAAIAGCSTVSAPPAETTGAAFRNADPDGANWLMYGRTSDDHRFSPLTQVNEQTASELGLVWSRELDTTRGLEATPLVENGLIYTTGSWSVVYALNAKTGEPLWTYDPKVPRSRAYYICCDVVNRGVAARIARRLMA